MARNSKGDLQEIKFSHRKCLVCFDRKSGCMIYLARYLKPREGTISEPTRTPTTRPSIHNTNPTNYPMHMKLGRVPCSESDANPTSKVGSRIHRSWLMILLEGRSERGGVYRSATQLIFMVGVRVVEVVIM
jgi:hypothetical protein